MKKALSLLFTIPMALVLLVAAAVVLLTDNSPKVAMELAIAGAVLFGVRVAYLIITSRNARPATEGFHKGLRG